MLCVCVRWKMVDCYVSRVQGTMQLLQEQDIIGRTSELARVFGIQFIHVLTRGSQVLVPLSSLLCLKSFGSIKRVLSLYSIIIRNGPVISDL